MKHATLHHNPGAGNETHSKEGLKEMLRREGFECGYLSTEDDFIVIAGGDGTVRKTVKELLQKHSGKIPPIGLLPMGTANNIATALSVTGNIRDIIRNWHSCHTKKFDVGTIKGVDDHSFFLEAIGYGVFPQLISDMEIKKHTIEHMEASEKIKVALEELHRIIPRFEAMDCSIEIDGQLQRGRYLLIEIMNIRSLGPNLVLAPDADPGDGQLNIVLIKEEQRFELALYVQDQLNGIPSLFPFPSVKANQITLQCQPPLLHIDDQLVESDSPETTLTISLQTERLSFFV